MNARRSTPGSSRSRGTKSSVTSGSAAMRPARTRACRCNTSYASHPHVEKEHTMSYQDLEAIIVHSYEHPEILIDKGGSHAWKVEIANADLCQYAVMRLNRKH